MLKDANINFISGYNYDDNDPGNDSGVGDIGTAVITDVLLSNGNNTLTIANGTLVLSKAF